MAHDLRPALWRLLLDHHLPRRTQQFDTSFAECGVPSAVHDSLLGAVEARFGITLEPSERRAAVSVGALADVVERHVSRRLLTEGIGPLAHLEWSADQGPPRFFRFKHRQGRDLTVEHSELLALSAELARSVLAPRIRALRAPRPATVVVVARTPFIQVLAFLAALRCGTSPLLVDAREARALAAGCDTEPLVLVEDGTALPSGSIPGAAVLVLPTDPRRYRTGGEPSWVADGPGPGGEPRWLRIDRRPGRTRVRASAQDRLLSLGTSWSELYPPAGWEQIVSWHPLSHDIGLAAGLLWPVLGRRSVTLMTAGHFRVDPAAWLRELGRRPGTLGLAPSWALRHVADHVTDSTGEAVDLSRVAVLATNGCAYDDGSAELFAHRFAGLGFSPSGFRTASRLEDPPGGLPVTG